VKTAWNYLSRQPILSKNLLPWQQWLSGEKLKRHRRTAGPENRGWVKTARNYLLRGPSYTALKSTLAVMQNFQLLHGCYGNRGSSRVNLNDTVTLPDPENKGEVKTARNCLLRGPSYTSLKFP